MLKVKSLEEFNAAFPPGKVLVFTRNAADAVDALHAILANHRERNDEIILCESEVGSTSIGFSSVLSSLNIPLDHISEEACVAISRLIEIEKPTNVYIPSFAFPFAFLALQVWEGVRRSAHRISIGVSELDQPLADVSVWVEHHTAHNTNSLKAHYLHSFRASCYGSELQGNALLIIDPKDTLAPYVPDRRPLIVKSDPLVTVIIRSAARGSLTTAINSIAQQTWPSIEIVIVNIGIGSLEVFLSTQWSSLKFNVVNFYSAGRSEAANAGMGAATGEFFVFLDDDDYLYPAHIFQLITALRAEPDRLVAYGGIRIEPTESSGQTGVASLLDEPFSLERLRLSNFIPVHACLSRRKVIDLGIRFDTSLHRYEDWDFWLQIAEISPFLHVPGTVGVYKVGNASGVAKAPVVGVYERWVARCGISELEKIADWALSENTPAALQLRGTLNLTLASHIAELSRLQIEYDGAVRQANETTVQYNALEEQAKLASECRNTELQELATAVEDAVRRTQVAADEKLEKLLLVLSQTRAENTQAQKIFNASQNSILDLEQSVAGVRHELSTVYNSTSWKILAPLRDIVTFLKRPRLFWLLVQAHGGGMKGVGQIAIRARLATQRYGIWTTLIRGYQMLSKSSSPTTVPPINFPIQVRASRGSIKTPTVNIDIVVCIHNALDDVRRCLNSIRQFTCINYTLILVDDGSAEVTQDFVAAFATEFSCVLVRHQNAMGYTRAANAGMRASAGAFVVLLNSDTIVGPDWIERLYTCIESDANLAMVGPLSNCASWQSIPEIESKIGGDWAENPLPVNLSPESMSIMVASDSARLYPRLSFLNGFCQMIRRRALDEVGLLDEESFPQGYGEENDLCIRLRKVGWQLAVSDDVWVFHAQSKSYTSERRLKLCSAAAETLARKHGLHNIEIGARQCRESVSLKGIRARAGMIQNRFSCIELGKTLFLGKKLLFILPSSDSGGGANVIMSEAKALMRMGVDVVIANLEVNRTTFERNYADNKIPTRYIAEPEEISRMAKEFDAVIASIFFTVEWISVIANVPNGPVLGYYVQDFEPNFFKFSSAGYQKALASYTAIPNLVCFCKSRWNRNVVLNETGVECAVIGASVDLDRFRPSDRPRSHRVKIAAMVRPNSPYRSPKATIDILNEVADIYSEKVEITTFGVDADDPAFQALNPNTVIKHLGKLNSQQLSEILDQSDIFLDFSTYQAMGLTAMEAMASNCAVVLPKNGGAIELADDRISAIYADVSDLQQCKNLVFELIKDDELRIRLADAGLQAVQAFHPEGAALKMLYALFNSSSAALCQQLPQTRDRETYSSCELQ